MTTNIPYGYKRDSDDPKKWVIDEEAAQIVKRIFSLCMEGKGPSQIAALLEKEKVLNPTAYKQREGRKTPHQTPENEYRWHESTVALYSSNTWSTRAARSISRPTPTPFGIRSSGKNPMEIARFSITPTPAIISLEVFDKVQEIRQHGTAERQQARAICSPVWCSATTASRSSTTPPPAILKSGRTSSSAPPIVSIRTSAADIISVPLCWNRSSGSTFRRSYR